MDRAVQRTDDDALQSKAAAAQRGYFRDDFLLPFCARAPPRLPLINIGTYCRVFGVNALVERFLNETSGAKVRNIVSLGAGSDTRPFRLLPACATGSLRYFELDFEVKAAKKRQIIARNPQLRAVVEQFGEYYHLIGCDLRKIDELRPEFEDLSSGPTLLLSECCLCYLSPERSDNVLRFFAGIANSNQLSVVLYEPISLGDEFGRVMAENLAMRGLSLPTIDLYPTLESQIERLRSLVGGSPSAASIETVYKEWVPDNERQRIGRLEFLDEVEEMYLLMRHYCIAFVLETPSSN